MDVTTVAPCERPTLASPYRWPMLQSQLLSRPKVNQWQIDKYFICVSDLYFFAPQETNISCVAPLLLEGRTTLDAAFGTFLYSAGISFLLFIGLLILFSVSLVVLDFYKFTFIVVFDYSFNC